MFEMRATATFNRGKQRIRSGDVFEIESQSHARDYMRRGMAVLTKSAPKASNKMAKEPENKSPSPAGGAAQPSSASPPAQASRRTTARRSSGGAGQAGTS